MKRALIFLLGLAVLAWAGKQYLDSRPKDDGPSTAKRRLDDVRDKRRVIEEDAEQRIKDTLQKADEAEKR